MAHALLFNPIRRRKGGPKKMTAKQAKYFGGGARRKRSTRRRRAAPVANNPIRRRKSTKRRASRARSYRARRRILRNPISFNGSGFIMDTLFPGVVGAGGALAVDAAMGSLPLPDFLTSGWGNVAARVAAAVGLGMVATKVVGRRFGESVMLGGVLVTVYDQVKPWIKSEFPNLPLGYWGNAPVYNNGMGVYVDVPGNGNYVDGAILAAPSIAATVDQMPVDDGSGMGSYVS